MDSDGVVCCERRQSPYAIIVASRNMTIPPISNDYEIEFSLTNSYQFELLMKENYGIQHQILSIIDNELNLTSLEFTALDEFASTYKFVDNAFLENHYHLVRMWIFMRLCSNGFDSNRLAALNCWRNSLSA
ncbi:Oidioi.mRNA.OKI2018_I69.chr2.g5203.t1.cds [Oikopleura dioica]|uniref:Oidioi.mRNA.OKI2018_I69.chr2.g5203.t1.cds n=1 Tax=Oikopleura dioica TaxID=34765 RepID=A0ABN7T3D7_OIKDI|nr:Oidioi.mRNA.OKI2018_I69.chr2.g5203.t1.cds [Oikopleura dioica]